MKLYDETTLAKMQTFIKQYQKENGKSPTYRQIGHSVGISSPGMVGRYIRQLEMRGLIGKEKDGSVAIDPRLFSGRTRTASLVGTVACGMPILAEENIEASYALPQSLFGDGELYLLHTHGESMVDIGIRPNDLIVIRRQNYADDGQIVVALIDGEATLKRLFHRDGKIVLHPENKAMKDIVVEDCEVQGVLVSCIKMY